MKWTDRIGRRVKLRDLRIVLAVAASLTRAVRIGGILFRRVKDHFEIGAHCREAF